MQKTNKITISDTEYKASGFVQGLEYEFRVYAQNEAGRSKVSRSTELVLCRDPIDPPGKPQALQACDISGLYGY